MIDIKTHPCFNEEAKHTMARVHLPVAPKCNIQCGYCNRKYDCANESRPGVTSAILSPVQALMYLNQVMEGMPELSTVGIAGPGDPFANADKTLETLRLIRKEHPNLLLCVSSNGLEIEPHIEELDKLEVSHITITLNSIHPDVLGKMYRWVRYNKKVYRGVDAGLVMQERQLSALAKLVESNMIVKVNYIVVPGVNDHLVEETAAFMAEMGVDLFNPMPLLPTAETDFENHKQPSPQFMALTKEKSRQFLPIMDHCERCRSDAVGKIGEDNMELQSELERISKMQFIQDDKPRVAVATMEGYLINQHLGEAQTLSIYEYKNDTLELVETRPTPPTGIGDSRWLSLAEGIGDCSLLIVNGVGHNPLRIIENQGLGVIETEGLIEEVLPAIFKGGKIPKKNRKDFKCGSSCSGGGEGC